MSNPGTSCDAVPVTDDIATIQAHVTPLLAAAPTAGAAGVAAFAPRAEDYARVFTAALAPRCVCL